METTIKVQNLCKSYGNIPAIGVVSFKCSR